MGAFEQLGLFDCPREVDDPEPHVRCLRSEWLEAQAAYYLHLMGRFMRPAGICSQAVRTCEIERLHHLRQAVLAKLGEASNGAKIEQTKP